MASDKVQELAEQVKQLPYAGQILTKIAIARANNDDKALNAAFDEARELLEANGMAPGDDVVEKIKQLDQSVTAAKERIAVLKERKQEILENHTAYHNFKDAQAALAKAKEEMNRALQGDGQFNNIMEQLASEKSDLDETKYTLSVYVVEYHARTHAQQVEVGEDGDARDVIVTGRLGRKGKLQTNLFSEAGKA